MMPLPSQFFLTSGSATSPLGVEAALDSARRAGGVHDLNLVPVTGVIPIGAREVKPRKIAMGTVLPALEQAVFVPPGERGGAAVAVALRADHLGGYAVATAGPDSARALRAELRERLDALARDRGVALLKPQYAVAEVDVPEDAGGGACLAALVLLTSER